MIKSYTDLGQSKKLAEILSLESADMWYLSKDSRGIEFFEEPVVNDGTREDDDIPCWSLAALLEICACPLLQQDVEGKWLIHDWTGAFPKMEKGYNNPVDACVAMIEKLHEQKVL